MFMAGIRTSFNINTNRRGNSNQSRSTMACYRDHLRYSLIMNALLFPVMPSCMLFSRLNSIDVKYQMWKLGVVFTDNVSLYHKNIL